MLSTLLSNKSIPANPPPGTRFATIRYPAYREYLRSSTNRPKKSSRIVAAGIGVVTLDPHDQNPWVVKRFLKKLERMTRVRVDWDVEWKEVRRVMERERYEEVYHCTENVYQLYRSKVLKEEFNKGYCKRWRF